MDLLVNRLSGLPTDREEYIVVIINGIPGQFRAQNTMAKRDSSVDRAL